VTFLPYDEIPDAADQLNVGEIIQRYARRTGDTPDNHHLSRKPVVQGQWVHNCSQAGRLLEYSNGWEILSVFRISLTVSWLICRVNEDVDDLETQEDDFEAQEEDIPSPSEDYGYAAPTIPIVEQVPSFAIPKVQSPSCQIPQTSSLEETLCRVMRASFGSG
jgi:hypothetical protein